MDADGFPKFAQSDADESREDQVRPRFMPVSRPERNRELPMNWTIDREVRDAEIESRSLEPSTA